MNRRQYAIYKFLTKRKKSKHKPKRILITQRKVLFAAPFRSKGGTLHVDGIRFRIENMADSIARYKKFNRTIGKHPANIEYMKCATFWRYDRPNSDVPLGGYLRVLKDTCLYKERAAAFKKYRIDMAAVGRLLHDFLVEQVPRTADYREAEYKRRNLRNETVHHIWTHYWGKLVQAMLYDAVTVQISKDWRMRIVMKQYENGLSPMIQLLHTSDGTSVFGGFDLHLLRDADEAYREDTEAPNLAYAVRKYLRKRCKKSEPLPYPYN